jgi:hypothetical protein
MLLEQQAQLQQQAQQQLQEMDEEQLQQLMQQLSVDAARQVAEAEAAATARAALTPLQQMLQACGQSVSAAALCNRQLLPSSCCSAQQHAFSHLIANRCVHMHPSWELVSVRMSPPHFCCSMLCYHFSHSNCHTPTHTRSLHQDNLSHWLCSWCCWPAAVCRCSCRTSPA